MNSWSYAFGRYWGALSPCFFISFASVSTPLLSMHVITKLTPLSFIWDTSELRSVTPNDRLLSANTTFADGYLSKDACTPLRQSADWSTVYASTPTLFLWSFLASHGAAWVGHVKH